MAPSISTRWTTLQRDSLHAGVPYGRNFDAARLIGSLRVSSDNASIVITEKGKTAAEMMVFPRYGDVQ